MINYFWTWNLTFFSVTIGNGKAGCITFALKRRGLRTGLNQNDISKI